MIFKLRVQKLCCLKEGPLKANYFLYSSSTNQICVHILKGCFEDIGYVPDGTLSGILAIMTTFLVFDQMAQHTLVGYEPYENYVLYKNYVALGKALMPNA